MLEQGFQEMLLAHWTTTWIYPYWSTFPRLWCGAEIAEKIFRKTDTRKKIESNLSNSELNYCVKGERMYATSEQASKQTKDISRFVQCFISIFGVTVNMVFITILLFACSFQYIYYYYHLQLSDAIFILWASRMKSIVVQPASRHTLYWITVQCAHKHLAIINEVIQVNTPWAINKMERKENRKSKERNRSVWFETPLQFLQM